MAYRGQSTKFGNKKTSQIASLTGMVAGDNVFNTEYAQVEVYNGSVWTNNNSVVMTAGATITEGQIVRINTSGQAVAFSNSPSSNAEFGVGVCQYGGTLGNPIVVRICGIAKCLVATGGVVLGRYAEFSPTAGSITDTIAPTLGTLGRILQTQTSGNLAYVFLTFIERA